eukprot:RCo048058
MVSMISIAKALGRELSPQEAEVLSLASPQCMAKINRDIARGANIEETLAELRVVHCLALQRRKIVESAVSEAAQAVLARLSRPPLTEELVLLAEIPLWAVQHTIAERMALGECFDDILEDLAMSHQHRNLMREGQMLTGALVMPVGVCPLAPTCPAHSGDLLRPTVVFMRGTKTLIGVSPVASWFQEFRQPEHQEKQATFTAAGAQRLCHTGGSEIILNDRATSSLSSRSSANLRVRFAVPVVDDHDESGFRGFALARRGVRRSLSGVPVLKNALKAAQTKLRTLLRNVQV